MACPVCGKASGCAHEPARAAVLADRESPARSLDQTLSPSTPGSNSFWRQEVVSRVQQHRARRRKRFDPDASLELDFQPELPQPVAPVEQPQMPEMIQRPDPPKIIRFPRPRPVQSVAAEEPAEMELAEPVLERPRILEAAEPPAEQMDLLPSFADIILDAEKSLAPEAVELPLQPAPLQHRIFAGLVDSVVVLIATAVFATTFMGFSRGLPPTRVVLLSASAIGAALWLIYHYLFLVYSAGTPGMQLAQLELCTFQGGRVSRRLRRGRALASTLSACSVGLGFAWALVDEDRLGWHDRITQTHLKRSN